MLLKYRAKKASLILRCLLTSPCSRRPRHLARLGLGSWVCAALLQRLHPLHELEHIVRRCSQRKLPFKHKLKKLTENLYFLFRPNVIIHIVTIWVPTRTYGSVMIKKFTKYIESFHYIHF